MKQVSVQFKGSARHYDYLTDIEDLRVGDAVKVKTRYGSKTVTVTSVPVDVPEGSVASSVVLGRAESEGR